MTFTTRISGLSGRWPSLPEWFSYSSLAELDLCPRRWSLERATYPDLWTGRGYPDLPHVASLLGDIIHGSLEQIVRAFADAGVVDTRSVEAVHVLRDLGGYTAIVTSVLQERVASLDSNPRIASRRQAFERALRDRVPEMRERVQSMLGRVTFTARQGAADEESGQRSPLAKGTHPEVDVRAEELRCAGRVDLISIKGAEVEITDYKTGTADPHHADQLRFYALLWSRDVERNPAGTSATRLRLSYGDIDVSVPAPSLGELDILEEDVRLRISAAVAALAHDPPPALPSAAACSYCPVRHMCEEYWISLDTPSSPPVGQPGLLDAEVTVVAPSGSRSVLCAVTHPGSLSAYEFLLRTAGPADGFEQGMSFRILVARSDHDEERDLHTLTLTAASEVYVLEPP